MLSKIKVLPISILVAGLLLFLSLSFAPAVGAQSQFKGELCGGADLSLKAGSCGDNNQNTLDGVIGAIINVISVIVGIAAVIMIIIGGFKFITSGGDSGRLTSAKQTIIYALVGLIVVALAQFVVRFILNKI